MLRIIIITFLVMLPLNAQADKVYLKGGEVIEGKVIQQSEALIRIKLDNGITRQFFKHQFDNVEIDLPDPDAQYEEEEIVLEELRPPSDISQDKQKLIEQIIYITGMRASVDKTISRVIDQAPIERREEMRIIFNAEDVIEQLKPIYDNYYTTEDLQKLVTFYNSPLGQKVLEVTPKISRDAMKATLTVFQDRIPR